MKRFRDRTGRALDAIVIVLAVPTLAIVATLGLREYDVAQSRALQSDRAALARCDGLSGPAQPACRKDARTLRRSIGVGAMPTDDALTQPEGIADALARAQCDVLTGHAADACTGIGNPRQASAQPIARGVTDHGAYSATSTAARKTAR